VPMHEDLAELLQSMAQLIACNPHEFQGPSFAATVASVVMLGARAQRPLDLIVEQVVADRATVSQMPQQLLLLKAFLCTTRNAKRAIGALAAGILGCLDASPPQEARQELARLCGAAQQQPLAACTGSARDPPLEEQRAWCRGLVTGGVEVAMLTHGTSDGPLGLVTSACSSSNVNDFAVDTADSLPYLDWCPSAVVDHEHDGNLGLVASVCSRSNTNDFGGCPSAVADHERGKPLQCLELQRQGIVQQTLINDEDLE